MREVETHRRYRTVDEPQRASVLVRRKDVVNNTSQINDAIRDPRALIGPWAVR